MQTREGCTAQAPTSGHHPVLANTYQCQAPLYLSYKYQPIRFSNKPDSMRSSLIYTRGKQVRTGAPAHPGDEGWEPHGHLVWVWPLRLCGPPAAWGQRGRQGAHGGGASLAPAYLWPGHHLSTLPVKLSAAWYPQPSRL